jgi:cytochrome c oxidase subunit II
MQEVVKLLGLPANASTGKDQVDLLLMLVHGLMLALFVGWFCYFVLVLFKFNKRRHPVADHVGVKSHLSSYLEAGVALIEGALLIGLALPLWAKTVDAFPTDTAGVKVINIKVIGQQFYWNAWYPGTNGVFVTQDRKFESGVNPFGFNTNDPNYQQNFVVRNDVYVPVNHPVVARISSLDVIHSFTIRPMRVTQDAIPGMIIPAWFTPAQIGNYNIQCAQLCGSGHYSMKGVLHVVSQADYDKWLQTKVSAAK